MSHRTIVVAKRSRLARSMAPVVDEPISQAPVVDEPVFQAPVADEPVFQAPVVDEPVFQAPLAYCTALFDDTLVDIPREVLKFSECKECSESPFMIDEKEGLYECCHGNSRTFYKCSICDLEHGKKSFIRKHSLKCNSPSDLHRKDTRQPTPFPDGIITGDTIENQLEAMRRWKRRCANRPME